MSGMPHDIEMIQERDVAVRMRHLLLPIIPKE
jgi:hypothetical protein